MSQISPEREPGFAETTAKHPSPETLIPLGDVLKAIGQSNLLSIQKTKLSERLSDLAEQAPPSEERTKLIQLVTNLEKVLPGIDEELAQEYSLEERIDIVGKELESWIAVEVEEADDWVAELEAILKLKDDEAPIGYRGRQVAEKVRALQFKLEELEGDKEVMTQELEDYKEVKAQEVIRATVEALHPDITFDQLSPAEQRRVWDDVRHRTGITIDIKSI